MQNAVLDALRPLGVTEIQLPLSPERVWRAIHEVGHDAGGSVPQIGAAEAAANVGPDDALGAEGLRGEPASPSGHGDRTD